MDELLKQHQLTYQDVHGVGFAVPCPVKNGYVVKCPNLKWETLDVISSMRSLLEPHVKVVVSNDANIAAYGENYSLEIPLQNAIFYTLGTGVGGGIIIEGKIVEGRTGAGGEIGHMPIFEGTEICGCGRTGCLEQVCGTKAILGYAKELSTVHESSIDFKELTVKKIFDAAKDNDPVGFRVLDRVAKYIALSASILSVSLDPDVIIIGGGIAKAGQILIDQILKHYRMYARFGTVDIPFVLAKTGNDAGIIGAAKYTI
jgi:glucokinase